MAGKLAACPESKKSCPNKSFFCPPGLLNLEALSFSLQTLFNGTKLLSRDKKFLEGYFTLPLSGASPLSLVGFLDVHHVPPIIRIPDFHILVVKVLDRISKAVS